MHLWIIQTFKEKTFVPTPLFGLLVVSTTHNSVGKKEASTDGDMQDSLLEVVDLVSWVSLPISATTTLSRAGELSIAASARSRFGKTTMKRITRVQRSLVMKKEWTRGFEKYQNRIRCRYIIDSIS
jgi:hypothetical protein